ALDVVDNRGLRPCEERRYDQADAFAAPRRSESQHVPWPVVAEGLEPADTLVVPTANGDTLPIIQESHLVDVRRPCASRRTVEVLRVCGKAAGPPEIHTVDKQNGQGGTGHHD